MSKSKQASPSLSLKQQTELFAKQEAFIRLGGGSSGEERQRKLGRLTARERLKLLLDSEEEFIEFGLWAAYEMYEAWGNLPAAGVITGIGTVQKRSCMVIANDATVKAGAFFPQTVKKVLRAQRIAYECRLPILYLVDSSGVFLPLQDEIFPDEDDFGRIFRNNAVLSAAGIPQFAAIMGNCIAGGAYLPVLCDKLLMTEGSGLYLAGPALVKAAIGQTVAPEELGGAEMHATLSGTVDFYEPNDPACLDRMKRLVALLPADEKKQNLFASPAQDPQQIYSLINGDEQQMYDIRSLLEILVDQNSLLEYKALYGQAIVTAYATIAGMPIGIVANQRQHTTTATGALELGGVIYCESADKAARFVMDCNQSHIPLLFLQDVVGFMVGKQAEQTGIIRSGAKLVNAVSNSIVPKITLLIGRSFGAGNYALCGKAYDPNFILAWPNAQCAVMGAEQAAATLHSISKEPQRLRDAVRETYTKQTDIRYAAARGWVDAIIPPHSTRHHLIRLLQLTARAPLHPQRPFHTGVLQV